MSTDKFLGCDVGLPSVTEFTTELLSEKVNPALANKTVFSYSVAYHKCAEHVMNREEGKAEELREALRNGDKI